MLHCLLAFLLVAANYTVAYKILVFAPKYGVSHTNFMSKVADTLLDAGHDVVCDDLLHKSNRTRGFCSRYTEHSEFCPSFRVSFSVNNKGFSVPMTYMERALNLLEFVFMKIVIEHTLQLEFNGYLDEKFGRNVWSIQVKVWLSSAWVQRQLKSEHCLRAIVRMKPLTFCT
ncbi:hypothetical protein TELCIR_09940 [Teladorsagia circumcincta]|uniref:Glucuronosyltransferase n=1 Tax=Teladorsagia circumcincta TaxID=45464 RepID=A0A2G9UDG3_TELCI|nr:hypothetical protein TELCIR_09940 [Teladorsagia circumcincta]